MTTKQIEPNKEQRDFLDTLDYGQPEWFQNSEVMDLAHTRARDAGRCHCSNCRPDLHAGKDN